MLDLTHFIGLALWLPNAAALRSSSSFPDAGYLGDASRPLRRARTGVPGDGHEADAVAITRVITSPTAAPRACSRMMLRARLDRQRSDDSRAPDLRAARPVRGCCSPMPAAAITSRWRRRR